MPWPRVSMQRARLLFRPLHTVSSYSAQPHLCAGGPGLLQAHRRLLSAACTGAAHRRSRLACGIGRLALEQRPPLSRQLRSLTTGSGASTGQVPQWPPAARPFSTSAPLRALPQLWLATAGRQALKFAAALGGRAIRKWYMNLPPDKQRKVYERFVSNKARLRWTATVVGLIVAAYLAWHVERTPYTGRWRFITLTRPQLDKVSTWEFENIVERYASDNAVLPAWDPRHKMVVRNVRRLLDANSDLAAAFPKNWQVFVVRDEVPNACVVPTGQICVMTGILGTFANEHQLSAVLAHEMAHAILGHALETYTWVRLTDWLVIVSLAFLWLLLPSDGIAAVATWFYSLCVKATLRLPYNRKLEYEADGLGLQLAAKACYDVREAYAYWRDMGTRVKAGALPAEPPTFMSTHPAHGERADRLELLVEEAVRLRQSCGCGRLPRADPMRRADHAAFKAEHKRFMDTVLRAA